MTRSLAAEEQRALSGTLYYFASVLAGDTRKAEAVKRVLGREFSASLYIDFIEPAYMGVACDTCEGNGTVKRPCDKCGATGQCKTCKGTGESSIQGLVTETRKCMPCAGTGSCRTCDGQKAAARPCRSCKNGFAPTPRRARETYLALLKHGAEGGDIPQIPRSTSLRAILATMDAAVQDARVAPSRTTMLAAVGQARQQARVAINNAMIRISGSVKDARPNGAGRVQVKLTGLDQCQQDVRDDRLQVQGWTAIELTGNASSAALFLRGARVELYGKPELLTSVPGSSGFPLDCTPIATVSANFRNYGRQTVGTIVMRDYSVTQSHRIFPSPFTTPPFVP